MSSRFPKPWTVEQTGRDEYVVLDANKQKLFYIEGDEGDDDEPPALLSEDSDDAAELLVEILTAVTRK